MTRSKKLFPHKLW